MMFTPLSQFDIYMIISLRVLNYFIIYLNNLNVAVFSLLGFFSITLYLLMDELKIIPNKIQYVLENIYIFVYLLVYHQVGKKGIKFFPLIMTIFITIILLNVIGLIIPHGFVVISYFVWSLYLLLSKWLGIFLVGLYCYIIKKFYYINICKNYVFIKNNKNIISINKNKVNHKLFKISKRNYYKNNSLLVKGENFKNILNSVIKTIKPKVNKGYNVKKIKSKKIADSKKVYDLVDSCKWFFTYVKQSEKPKNNLEILELNEKFNKSIELQQKHLIVCGVNENNEGLFGNFKTPGKNTNTMHIKDNELYSCANDSSSNMTVFEDINKFRDKSFEFTKITPVSEIKADGYNLESRILKSVGGSESALKNKIKTEGYFVDLEGKWSKFDN